MNVKKILISAISAVLLLNASPLMANAATLAKETTKTALFPVPNGGYSSCKLKVRYEEHYAYSTAKSRNVFSSRSISYGYKLAYATAKPSVSVENIKHYNGDNELKKTFEHYNNQAVMYSPNDWDYWIMRTNSKQRTYSQKTKYYGRVRFSIWCDSAFVPTQTGSVKINLKTK